MYEGIEDHLVCSLIPLAEQRYYLVEKVVVLLLYSLRYVHVRYIMYIYVFITLFLLHYK